MRAGLDVVMNLPDRPPPAQTSVADHPVLYVSMFAWDDAPRRLRHLLSRWARQRPVAFVEAPVPTAGPPRIDFDHRDGLVVATPFVPRGLTGEEGAALLRGLLDGVVRDLGLRPFALWHDSPRALAACPHLKPAATVYHDWACAPPPPHEGDEALREEALRRADAAFVDGPGHACGPNVHLLAGRVDAPHFARAGDGGPEPADQRDLPHPRLGFHGALDRDLDLDLLAAVADLRTDYHIVLIDLEGSADRSRLPRRANIHDLGRKSYAELPAYVAGWDVALLPYTREAAARGVDPTQTLEYLAAGKPVVATPIPAVINPYAIQGVAAIAEEAEDFVIAVECELQRLDRRRWQHRVHACLRGNSWDDGWIAMEAVLAGVMPCAAG
ncbi:glycosyltransferase [Nannocystis punicea]|uniref:Glycosyltransferase n=1 Tax=Nannocystis punicea TaxID=2995304 RepID=A0ABY7GS88_9BACT|nr:glycosyltransferase [Nannocystis poenicansa]WAS89791.1 glycosyltransferase [Nannocystis poenicansa]